MTVTISRLYDSYADAQRAVSSLEAAGVPHSDLSIVANNSDDWYGSIAIATEPMIAPKAPPLAPVSARVLVVPQACSPVLVCWRFPD